MNSIRAGIFLVLTRSVSLHKTKESRNPNAHLAPPSPEQHARRGHHPAPLCKPRTEPNPNHENQKEHSEMNQIKIPEDTRREGPPFSDPKLQSLKNPSQSLTLVEEGREKREEQEKRRGTPNEWPSWRAAHPPLLIL